MMIFQTSITFASIPNRPSDALRRTWGPSSTPAGPRPSTLVLHPPASAGRAAQWGGSSCPISYVLALSVEGTLVRDRLPKLRVALRHPHTVLLQVDGTFLSDSAPGGQVLFRIHGARSP